MGVKRSKDKRAMAPGCHASGGTEAGIGEAVGRRTPEAETSRTGEPESVCGGVGEHMPKVSAGKMLVTSIDIVGPPRSWTVSIQGDGSVMGNIVSSGVPLAPRAVPCVQRSGCPLR